MPSLLNQYFSFVSRLLPQDNTVSAVGLDVGVDSCKLIEIRRTADIYEVLNWGIEPILKEGVDVAIQQLFSRLKIEPKSLATSVFGKGTIIRFIEMPRMPIEELRKSFELEVDKHFPFPKDQIYTGFYILDPKSKDKKMHVMIAAVKRELLNERLNFLTRLNLPTDYVTINSIAIANVFHHLGPRFYNEGIKNAGFAILDMGETVSNLIIMNDFVPCFTRDIFLGGQELNRRISNVFGISVQEARDLKMNPQQKTQDVLSASETVLMSLVSEIRLSFDYFSTEYNLPIVKLFLTGGTSLLNGMVEFFSKNLEISVERWNPIQHLQLAPHINSQDISSKASRLGVSLGLAMSCYD